MKSGSNSHTMKVVIPHSNTKNQHIKKEYLASTIKPENTFALMCESTLNEIYEQSSNIKSVDTYVDSLIEFGVARSINSKITLRRSNTSPSSAPLDIDETTAGEGSKRFENVIERQRAEIDDLRTRLIDRKRLEDTWKETVHTLLQAVKVIFKQQKQKLAVANAKCKLVDLAKNKNNPVITPTGKCAQQLAQWASEIAKKSAEKTAAAAAPRQTAQYFMIDKKHPNVEHSKNKRLVLLRNNNSNSIIKKTSSNSRPIIMMRTKPTIKREPVYEESPPMPKVARLSFTNKKELTNQSAPIMTRPLGAMSPDSGCGDYASDGNVSSPGSTVGQSTQPTSPPTTPTLQQQNDMSTMIEQAFARSVGQIPATPPPTPTVVTCKEEPTVFTCKVEAPVSPLSSDLGAVDMDLFDQLDLTAEMFNQQAPPWEELDIAIEPSFTSITPFLNL